MEGPPHQAEGGTCPLEITFSLLVLSSLCYRGGGVRALGKVGLPIFSDWPPPTSHFMSCKILYVFAVFDVEGSSLNSSSSLLYVNSCLVPIAAAALGGLVLQERLGKVLSAIALPWAFFFLWLPVLAGGLFLSPLATITF